MGDKSPMIQLAIPYEEKDEAKLQARRESISLRWNPDEKFWYIDSDQIPESFKKYLPQGNKPGTTPEKKRTNYTHVLQIDFSYYKLVRPLGATWLKEHGVYVFKETPTRPLPLELTGFEPKPFSWEELIQQKLNSEKVKPTPPRKEITLRDHQKVVTRETLKAMKHLPGFLLADDVGLGKTYATWISILNALKNESPAKILIISPLSAVPVWTNAILDLGNPGHTIVVLNYDRLKRLFQVEDPSKGKSLKGIAKFGKAAQFDIIIFDESHYLKNLTSARTKLALKLYPQAGFMFWLSATAGENPLELGYLFPLLAARTGDKLVTNPKNFEEWCKKHKLGVSRGKFGKWNYEESSESNQRIHELLFKPQKGILGAIRREPKDIRGWPEIQRIPTPVELDSKSEKLYQLAWEEFLESMKNEPPKKKGGKPSTAFIANITRLRQKASLLRAPHTLDLTLELLSNHRQVAISCQYLHSLNEIQNLLKKEGINASVIQGKTPPKQKEEQRLLYQTGENKVVLFTVEAAISLHQGEHNNTPRTQINHDLRWSAIQTHQIDGRSHRDGKFAPVYWPYLENTIEERVLQILLAKVQSMNQIHGTTTSSELVELYDTILEFSS